MVPFWDHDQKVKDGGLLDTRDPINLQPQTPWRPLFDGPNGRPIPSSQAGAAGEIRELVIAVIAFLIRPLVAIKAADKVAVAQLPLGNFTSVILRTKMTLVPTPKSLQNLRDSNASISYISPPRSTVLFLLSA